MRTLLRFVVLLALIVWLGGIIFFSAAVAPNVFAVLVPVAGGRHLAGEIVARALHALHVMGIFCGVLLLVCLTLLRKSVVHAANFLVLIMLLLTCASHFFVIPRIERIRLAAYAEKHEPSQTEDFDRLHKTSVALESGVLLLGVGVVWLVAKEPERS